MGIFGKKKKNGEEKNEAQAAKKEEAKAAAAEAEEAAAETAAEEEQEEPDFGRLPPMKEGMQTLWQLCHGDDPEPTLSLTALLPPERLVLDNEVLESEVRRISGELERDALLHLRSIEEISRQYREAIERGEEPGDPAVDAVCRVYVSKDGMVAWLMTFPPLGAGEIKMETVANAMEEKHITSGFEPQAMLRCFQYPYYFQFYPIAVGTPPQQGEDGRIVEHFAREQSLDLFVDANGTADYKTTNYVRQVHKGDVLCDIIPPTPGRSGVRVDGQTVEPRPVKEAKPPKGVNTTITDDGLHLIATMDGHLEFQHNGFQVRPVLVIRGDVDYSVGNIHFIGDVQIKGDVREGFIVTATGAVTVDGIVEAATIESGGNLTITRGVVGDNRALLRSNGRVRAKYLENCVVYAGNGIIADCIMNSQVFSDTTVEVTTGRGSIIGGAVVVAEKVKAKLIGAESGRATEITMGVLPYAENELRNLESDIAACIKERQEVTEFCNLLEQTQGMEGNDEQVARARMRRSVLGVKQQHLKKRKERFSAMEVDITRCRLECGTLYASTVVRLGNLNWTAKENWRNCAIFYDREIRDLRVGLRN